MRAVFWLTLAASILGCERAPQSSGYAGYLEADYRYAMPSLAGRITELTVERGTRVPAGAVLFSLDALVENAAEEEAAQRVKRAEAVVADLGLGRRAPEVAALQAQLAQAQASAALAEQERVRAERLGQRKLIAQDLVDTRRSEARRAAARVRETQAQLAAGALPGRPAEIVGAEAEVAAAQAALRQAQWRVAQRQVSSVEAAYVDEVLFRPGEFVASGQPVLRLLPDARRRARFFVPALVATSLKLGQTVQVALLDGRKLPAQIEQIASSPEYTPPVIYSNERRETLVFRVEARIAPEQAVALAPGLPITVSL